MTRLPESSARRYGKVFDQIADRDGRGADGGRGVILLANGFTGLVLNRLHRYAVERHRQEGAEHEQDR